MMQLKKLNTRKRWNNNKLKKKKFHDDNDILKQLDKEPNGVSEDGVYNMVNKIKNKKKF